MSLEHLTSQEAIKLSKKAGKIDLLDCFVGPLSSLCMYSDSEYLFQFGLSLSLAELAFVKLPYLLNYTFKTGDVKGFFYLGIKETVANIARIGGFLDIAPAYLLRTNYYLRNKL